MRSIMLRNDKEITTSEKSIRAKGHVCKTSDCRVIKDAIVKVAEEGSSQSGIELIPEDSVSILSALIGIRSVQRQTFSVVEGLDSSEIPVMLRYGNPTIGMTLDELGRHYTLSSAWLGWLKRCTCRIWSTPSTSFLTSVNRCCRQR